MTNGTSRVEKFSCDWKIWSQMDIEAETFCNKMYNFDHFMNEMIDYHDILSRNLVPY